MHGQVQILGLCLHHPCVHCAQRWDSSVCTSARQKRIPHRRACRASELTNYIKKGLAVHLLFCASKFCEEKGLMTVSKGTNQHVTPHKSGGWQVIGARGERATRVTSTKQEAIDIGRRISRNQHSELVIHGRDGRIQEKDSHGHDPFPPRG